MPKQVYEDIITAEVNGNTYEGRRLITGSRVKYQTISYAGIKKDDSMQYPTQRQHLMTVRAKLILSELVKEHHKF